jgi:hypothetical protein
MKHILQMLVLVLFPNLIWAQGTTFSLNEDVRFLNENNDTMAMPFLGGMNQPQFYSLDINNDGVKDIFAFDRTGQKVMSLIHQGNGKYSYQPKYDHIFPVLSSWVVFKDYNKDGKEDLWYKNDIINSISLYRNVTAPGDPHARFELVRETLRAYNFGQVIDTSDIYCDKANIPSIEDVDGDGDMDILTLQTVGFGVTLFLNSTVENGAPLDPPQFEEIDVCWGDFTEGDSDNAIYLERYKFCYRKAYRYLKKHAGGSSMLLIDHDNDNDMDLVLGNAGFDNLIYLENGKSDLSRKIDTMIAYDTRFPSYDKPARVKSFPAAYYLDVDGDTKKDLLVAPNLTDKFSGLISEFDNVRFYKNEGTAALPLFRLKDSTWMNDQFVDLGNHTVPLLFDVDADGDLDLIVSTNQGHSVTQDEHDALYLYENIGTKTNAVFKLINKDFLSFDKDSLTGIYPTIGDINKDGDPELIIGMYNGTVSLYDLSGKGSSMQKTLISHNAFNIQVGYNSAPHIGDVDGDGTADLLIGCYNGHVWYYNNKPQSGVPKLTLVDDSLGGILVNEMVLTTYYDADKDEFRDTLVPLPYGNSAPFLQDLDGNGNPELVVGSMSGMISGYANIRNDLTANFSEWMIKEYELTDKTCYAFDAGSDAYPALGDLNGDGEADMMSTNSRGGLTFRTNVGVQCTASNRIVEYPKHLFQIYPNPSSGIINLKSELVGERLVRVYNTSGQIVTQLRTSSNQIDLSHMSAGLYFIEYSFAETRVTGRVLLEK